MTKVNTLFHGVFSVLFLVIFFISCPALASHELEKGPAFTDPSIKQEMPSDWISAPIKYPDEAGDIDLAIDINQQLYPLLVPMIQEYAKQNDIKIAFTESTCGKSAGLLERKEVDMGGFCCPPGELDRLPGLKYHTLGIMPLAILINPDNPVTDITVEQARNIFAGEIRRWSEIGGEDLLIKPVASLHCKKRPGHWRLLLKDENQFGTNIIEEGDMADTIALISSSPAAIGYETLLVADRFKHRGAVKYLNINGADPKDPGSLLSLKYPLYRTYNITTWEGPNVQNPHADKLVKYLIERANEFQGEYNFIPASKLMAAGWKFKGDELIGEPLK